MADIQFGVDIIMKMVDNNIKSANSEMDKLFATIDKTVAIQQKPIKGGLLATERTEKQIGLLNGYAKSLTAIEAQFGSGSKQANAYFTQVTKGSKQMGVQLKKAQKVAQGFSFDFLGLIFGGMTLQRVFGGAFKSLKENYLEIAGANDTYSKKVGQLGDAFGFLKFTIFEAFASNSIVDGFMDSVISGLDWLGEFFDDHPNWANVITGTALALGAIGTVLFTWGSIKQFTNIAGIFDTIGKLAEKTTKLDKLADSIEGVGSSAETTGTQLGNSKLFKGIGVVAGLTLAGFSVAGFIKSLEDEDISGAIGYGVAGAMGVAGAITALFNPVLGIGLTILGGILFSITKYKTEIVTAINGQAIVNSFFEGLGQGVDEDGNITAVVGVEAQAKFLALEIINLESSKEALKDSLDFLGSKAFIEVQGEILDIDDKISELTGYGTIISDNFGTILEQQEAVVEKFGTDVLEENIWTRLNTDLGDVKDASEYYVQTVVPALDTAYTDEGSLVDALAGKYNNLARAKERAASASSGGNSSQVDNTVGYTTYGLVIDR